MVYQYKNFGLSTLSETLDGSETDVDVVNASSFPTSGDFVINVEGELMKVTAVSSNTFTVERGAEGTDAVSHPLGAQVKNVLTADMFVSRTKLLTYASTAGSNVYIPDADLPRIGSALYTDGANSGSGIINWYRQGTYNSVNGTQTGTIMEFRGTTLSEGTGSFSFWIENNNAGARLVISNNVGYQRTFSFWVWEEDGSLE